jgi:glucosyl-3-phosphoglycerate synthase
MADFHQGGGVATLHNLTRMPVQDLERQLRTFAEVRKITLILPSLFSELEGPALAGIVDALCGADYINHIVIGLDQADADQFAHAREYFSRLPQRHEILWNDGPRLRAIDQQLEQSGLAPNEAGKGRNAWYCIGYTLASPNSDVVALHDCDIVTYSRDMLARLLYPVANPAFPYLFCKGYYPRIADGKLNGRVARLLVTPLLLALQRTCGHNEYLDYLQGFRYPLAGEFAMRTAILPNIRIPSDWGLEIGMLSEVWRNLNHHAVCQVDISDAYDHKHQPLSADDAGKGLSRMSTDISKALFRKLATDGVVFSQETFRTLKATYLRIALDLIEMYYHDAMMNGLHIDRHIEEKAVELFASNVVNAGQLFLDTPNETPFIANWSRVNAALPDLMQNLRQAVHEDNQGCPD